MGDLGSIPELGRSPGGGYGYPLQYSCPEDPHGQRNLEGYSPWGRKELDMTQWLSMAQHSTVILKIRFASVPTSVPTRLSDFTFTFHFSLSCIGEGNGNPLQCSCLENPRDNGAWWAAVYGVAQSQTRLKWFSSSSSHLCSILDYCYYCCSSGDFLN